MNENSNSRMEEQNNNDQQSGNSDQQRNISQDDREGRHGIDTNQGMSWSPNDASGVRSGGRADMDNQTVGGAGSGTAAGHGSGSGLAPKSTVTGSDFDGQNATS